MFMFSIKSLSLVEQQINKIHARIVAALRQLDFSQRSSCLRDDAVQLHAAAFGDLANNDTLPFFRPHFLEISGSMVNLARRMDALFSYHVSLKPEERYRLANLSEIFIALGGIVEIFMHVWAYLNTDMKKAGEELQGAAERISRFEDFAAKQNPDTAALLAPITDALYMTDISMKKLVVLLRP